MDWRENRLLVVCILHLLINVDCSSLPFGNGGMDIMDQRGHLHDQSFQEKPRQIIQTVGITPCILNCKIKQNPCDSYFGRKGCRPPNARKNQSKVSPSSSPPPQPQLTTTKTKTTTTTKATTATIPEKDVTEEQHYTFTTIKQTIASPSPPSTTTATGGITVNPPAFWMISKKK